MILFRQKSYQFFSISHLRDFFRMDKRSDLDMGNSGIGQVLYSLNLQLGWNNDWFKLKTIPGADFDECDFFWKIFIKHWFDSVMD